MKLIKTYENCFSLIRDLYDIRLVVSMVNIRHWTAVEGYHVESKIVLPSLTKYDCIDVNLNEQKYYNYSDLDVLCEFLEEVLKEISIFYGEHPDITEEERFDFSKYLE